MKNISIKCIFLVHLNALLFENKSILIPVVASCCQWDFEIALCILYSFTLYLLMSQKWIYSQISARMQMICWRLSWIVMNDLPNNFGRDDICKLGCLKAVIYCPPQDWLMIIPKYERLLEKLPPFGCLLSGEEILAR